MSGALYNLAAMTVASTGTGTITLGAAAKINGVQYLSFSSAGVPDGQPVYYSINDPSGASEAGLGTYTASGTILTRGPITSTNANAAINMSASAIVRITPPTSQFIEVLTAPRNYYVLTTGSDSNTGLANTSGGAFLTTAKAISVAQSIYNSGFAITIQVGPGTWPQISVSGPFFGGGIVTIQGDLTTPSNVVVSAAAQAIVATNLTVVSIGGFKVTSSANDGVYATKGSILSITGKMEYGACSQSHIHANYAGSIFEVAASTITGNAAYHYWSETTASNVQSISQTVTLTGTPAFTAFARADIACQIVSLLNTFTGAATGLRYNSTNNAVIATFGAGATYFPGNAAGTTATGGIYS